MSACGLDTLEALYLLKAMRHDKELRCSAAREWQSSPRSFSISGAKLQSFKISCNT